MTRKLCRSNFSILKFGNSILKNLAEIGVKHFSGNIRCPNKNVIPWYCKERKKEECYDVPSRIFWIWDRYRNLHQTIFGRIKMLKNIFKNCIIPALCQRAYLKKKLFAESIFVNKDIYRTTKVFFDRKVCSQNYSLAEVSLYYWLIRNPP